MLHSEAKLSTAREFVQDAVKTGVRGLPARTLRASLDPKVVAGDYSSLPLFPPGKEPRLKGAIKARELEIIDTFLHQGSQGLRLITPRPHVRNPRLQDLLSKRSSSP